MISVLLALIAVIALPGGYFELCKAMRDDRVEQPPVIPYFVLFGTAGGWLLAFSVLQHLWAMGALIFALFLYASTAAVLGCCAYLVIQRQRSVYHRTAFKVGVGYLVMLIVIFFCANYWFK